MERRRCRDVFFLLVFAAFWGGMIYIAYLAYTQGDAPSLRILECPG